MGIGKVSSLAVASLSKVSRLAKLSIGKISGFTASFAAALYDNTTSFYDGLPGNNKQISYGSMSPQLNATDFTNGTAGSFTFSCWMKNDSLSRYRDDWVTRDYSNKCQIEVRSTYVRVVQKVAAGGWQSGYAYKSLSVDTWYHIAFSINTDTGVMKIYIDGEHLGTKTSSDIETSIWSGASGGFNIVYYVGKIDELAIYDGVLSDDEVDELYGGGDAADLSLLATYSDCVEWWNFNDTTFDGSHPDTILGEKGHDTTIGLNAANPDLLSSDVPSS